MNPSARPLTIALIVCLSLAACRERPQEEDASNPMATPPELNTSAEPTTLQQEIADLQRSIKTHEQNIEDLNAVVIMERDKVDENPDYDSPILQETLHEQEQERLEIEKAQERLKTLSR